MGCMGDGGVGVSLYIMHPDAMRLDGYILAALQPSSQHRMRKGAHTIIHTR